MDQIFSNREIAVSIWVLLFFSWAFTREAVRNSAKGVVSDFCHPKILIVYMLMGLYVYLVVDFLHGVGFWDHSQLKNTLMWFVFIASLEVFKASSINEEDGYFINSIKGHFKLLAIFEFIVAFHSFSLPVELIIVPVTSIAAAMLALSESKKEYKFVESFISTFLSVAGILMLIYGLYYISSEFEKFAREDTLMGFITPIVLSLLSLPFIFLLSIYARYESTLVIVNIYTDNKFLRFYAKLKGLMYFKQDYKNMRKWIVYSCASDYESRQSINDSISDYHLNKKEMV